RFDGVEVPDDVRRKLNMLKTGLTLATPADPAESKEGTEIPARMEGIYGRRTYCLGEPNPCLDINVITRVMPNGRCNTDSLDVWQGWRTVSPPMRDDYTRFVELSNKGARELGFADTGAMWRSKYDMPADEFSAELDRLWEQVRPLYLSLHAYVRTRLQQRYGA